MRLYGTLYNTSICAWIPWDSVCVSLIGWVIHLIWNLMTWLKHLRLSAFCHSPDISVASLRQKSNKPLKLGPIPSHDSCSRELFNNTFYRFSFQGKHHNNCPLDYGLSFRFWSNHLQYFTKPIQDEKLI